MTDDECDVVGCNNPDEVPVESTEYNHRYHFCVDCAEARTNEYEDLEVVE